MSRPDGRARLTRSCLFTIVTSAAPVGAPVAHHGSIIIPRQTRISRVHRGVIVMSIAPARKCRDRRTDMPMRRAARQFLPRISALDVRRASASRALP